MRKSVSYVSSPAGCAALLLCGQLLALPALLCDIPAVLLALTVANLVVAYAASVNFKTLFKTFVIQSLIITLCYLLRFSWHETPRGLLLSWKLTLAYIPLLACTSLVSFSAVAELFSRRLPFHAAFTLSVCINIFPVLLKELQDIYAIQKMRGACLAPRFIWRPLFWKDLFNSVLVPALAVSFQYADRAYVAACLRDMLPQGEKP